MGFFRRNKPDLQVEEVQEPVRGNMLPEEPYMDVELPSEEIAAVPVRRKITLDELKAPEERAKTERFPRSSDSMLLTRERIEKENLQKKDSDKDLDRLKRHR